MDLTLYKIYYFYIMQHCIQNIVPSLLLCRGTSIPPSNHMLETACYFVRLVSHPYHSFRDIFITNWRFRFTVETSRNWANLCVIRTTMRWWLPLLSVYCRYSYSWRQALRRWPPIIPTPSSVCENVLFQIVDLSEAAFFNGKWGAWSESMLE